MVRNYKPVGDRPCQRPYTPEDLQSALVQINAGENLRKVFTVYRDRNTQTDPSQSSVGLPGLDVVHWR